MEETVVLSKSDNVQLSSSSSSMDDDDGKINTLLLPFQCSFCDKTFRGHVKLLQHIAWDHQNAKIEIQCVICNLVFSRPLRHMKHLFQKHLKGAPVDLFEKVKNDLGCDEKWSKQRVYPNRKNRSNIPAKKKKKDVPEPKPNKFYAENDTKKLKPEALQKTKCTQKSQSKSSPKNQESFACTCGQNLKSQEHLEAHKSAHNIRIDPTIKCHLCAGAFDSVDDWLLHNCQRDVNANLEQAFHRPEPDQVTSTSPLLPACADISVASPASPQQDCDSPVASPSSPPQDCESPVASPASPPQNCDSPVGSPGSPSPECDFPAPAPSSTSRPRDDFTELLKTFQKVIDDLPPPTRQPLDHVAPVESSSLDDLGHDDDDMECGSPAEPPSSSPQNSEGLGTNDPQVPPEPSTKTAKENQGASDFCGQSQDSQQEILVVDLASLPPASARHQDCQRPKTTKNVKKSKKRRKNRTATLRKRQMPPPDNPQDLEIFNLLGEFNLQPSYNCDGCAARYKFKLHLVEHKLKYCKGPHAKSSEYNGCRMCGQEFSSKQDLDAHYVDGHKESRPGSWACDECDNLFDWEAALKFHKDTTHRKIRETRTRTCRFCSKSLRNLEDIIKHYQTEHPDKKSLCRTCGEQFKNRYEKREHEKKKHGVDNWDKGKVVCEVCGQEMWKGSLKRHVASRHAEKNFLCTNCGEGFGSLEILQAHEAIHLPTEDMPCSCKFCSYRSAQVSSLEIHMARRHLDHDGFVEYDTAGKEKPFICDECGKTYTSEAALEEHKIFHGERTYKCRKCGEFMFTRYHLMAHRIEVHQAEPRPCPNPNCSKTFTNRKSLYLHKRTCGSDPTNDSAKHPFKCGECGKLCGTKADLAYHIRSAHLKTFAYHCKVCGKGSYSKSNLKAHMKVHGGGHECEVCQLKFSTFPLLCQHHLSEHGKELGPRNRKFRRGLKSIVESLKESSEMT